MLTFTNESNEKDFSDPYLTKDLLIYFFNNMALYKDQAYKSMDSLYIYVYLHFFFLYNQLPLEVKTAWLKYSESLSFRASPRMCWIGQNMRNSIVYFNKQHNFDKTG
jgi:hypothetical protein